MKVVIFAGGVGTRLWPLSRRKTPKQFEKIIGGESTLQMTVKRLIPTVSYEDIYISTGKHYKKIVEQQLNQIPKKNIIGEPEKKDVGPAVCLMMGYLSKRYPDEPVLILWSDHIVNNTKKFSQIIKAASIFIEKEKNKIVFIGQKPRFPSENLGWIEFGNKTFSIKNVSFYEFRGLKYRPDKLLAEKYFKGKTYCWNLGYFVSTPKFIYSLYKRFAPRIFQITEKILSSTGQDLPEAKFENFYSQMPEINFDNAILEQLDLNFALVVVEDVGWSDIGSWEALKEALQRFDKDNIVKGEVILKDSVDNLVYEFNKDKLLVGIDLENILVVDTSDVLLIGKKTSVSKIKKLVESFNGTKYEKFT